MDIFKKTVLCVFVSASLIACGGGGGSDDSASNNGGTTGTTYKIENGAFQKGPFVAGTTVTIQSLDENLKPTGVTYTALTDVKGRFNVPSINSRFVEVSANGYYFDELSYQKSKAPFTLRAILDLQASSSKPSINTLTTLQTDRLRVLKASGKTFQEAQTSSKNAVLDVFGVPKETISNLSNLDLIGTSTSDDALLRATVSLLLVASSQGESVETELAKIFTKLADDLKNDGQANELAKDFLPALQSAKTHIDTVMVRTQIQEYLEPNSQTEQGVIGDVPLPKLSQWISVSSENDLNGIPVVWLLHEDGTLWKWKLEDGQTLQKIGLFKDIVVFRLASTIHRLVALDKTGNVYLFNTQTEQFSLVDTNVKQVNYDLYLKKDGSMLTLDKKVISSIPLMSRFVSATKGKTYRATGGIGKDGEFYHFTYSANSRIEPIGVVKLGKYSQAEVIFQDIVIKNEISGDTTVTEYPRAILNGNMWSFFDKEKQVIGTQILPYGTVSTYSRGFGFDEYSPVLAGDGYLWYWSESEKKFIKSSCGNVKKADSADLVLLNSGSVTAIKYSNTGKGNVTCDESSAFEHLTTKQVKDVYLTGGAVIAITADNKLIARSYTSPQWQGAATIYTVNVPN